MILGVRFPRRITPWVGQSSQSTRNGDVRKMLRSRSGIDIPALTVSPAATPPPRRPSLSLATEPALPFRGVDARPRVRLASRHVVDTHSFPVDVPLDAALAGIAPHYSFKPFPAAPAPRRHEVPSPHPATGGLRCGLLRNVIARILPVRERPPLRDHPRIHVLTSEAAHGDDSPVAVTVALLADDRTSGDALAKRTGRRGTAGPRLTCNAAGLLRLRSINPMESNPLGANPQGIAVSDASGAH